MRKIVLFTLLGISALLVNAQQWAGSTTTADTIYRNGMVRMIGATGERLMQHGEHSYTFNLSDLKQGIYLLTLKTSNGGVRNLKIEKI